VDINVSDEYVASIFRVKASGYMGKFQGEWSADPVKEVRK
jgi:hypothetical protein